MRFEKKQHGGTTIKIIIGVVALLVVAAIGSFFFSPVAFKAFIVQKITQQPTTPMGNQGPSTVFATKEPRPFADQTVTQRATAKEGGTLELVDPKGVKVTLTIPAGALEKDTDISMAPLEEVPIKDYTSALSNGVVIEPEGLQFKKTALLLFDFKPSPTPPQTFSAAPDRVVKLAAEELDLNSIMNQLKNLQQQTEQINTRIQNPAQNAGGN